MKIFSVRDKVADAFLQPFFSVNEGSAIRSLSEVVSDANHPFGKSPHDYSLWFIGTYDDSSGVILPSEPTRQLQLADLKTPSA